MTILFLAAALVFVLLAGSKLADRMAGCYVDMAGEEAAGQDNAGSQEEAEPTPGTNIKIRTQ